MKMVNTKKGFTLIELLVVITIIGILATGAVSVYTSQIQKARDTTRLGDVNALKSSIEQVYQDSSEYPHADTFFTEVSLYMEKFPKDSKHAQNCNNGGNAANTPSCAYAYIASQDSNGIDYGSYEVSTAFENEGNVLKKAALDGGGTGVEEARLELGLDIVGNVTGVAASSITEAPGACTIGGGEATDGEALIIINGNPTTTGAECG